jgi:hypothetical protein
MSILGKLTSIFKKPEVKSEYQRQQNSRLISAGWWGNRPYWPNHVRSIQKEVTVHEWRTIVSASNKLYWNFGVIAGAIEDKGMLCIGKAWTPRFLGEDKEWGKIAAEWLLGQWYPVAYVNGISFTDGLYLDSISLDRDGDSTTILTETDRGYPQLQQIPWHAIGSRNAEKVISSGPYRGLRQYNGVIQNEFDRPVAYVVLGETEEQDRTISARSVDFLIDPKVPGQLRGFPIFTSALMDLRDLTTTQGYIKQAVAAAASIGLIEHNDMGMADPSDPAYALQDGPEACNPQLFSEELMGGMVRYFRAGSGAKLEQMDNTMPSESTNSLLERLIRNALLSAGMPPEFYWEPKGTGANVRLIAQKVNRTIQDRQQTLAVSAKRRISYAVAKAIKLGLIPPYKGKDQGGMLKWDFSFPPVLTTDVGHAGNDAREAYRLGLRTMTEILAESGRNIEQHLDERAMEEIAIRERMQKYNLPESSFRVLLATGNPPDLTGEPAPDNSDATQASSEGQAPQEGAKKDKPPRRRKNAGQYDL